MKRIYLFITFSLLFLAGLHAQVENIIVEKYYVADTTDAKDTTYGKLTAGAITYRVYIDLAQGTTLKKIYGDINHPLQFKTTTSFYNQTDRGEVFGSSINNRRLNQNTLALDSWITLGQATNKHIGVEKNKDTDGSIVGGVNNADGLLNNEDPASGTPLSTADGLLPLAKYYPITLNYRGFSEFDSTIFDKQSKTPGLFYSTTAYIKDTTDLSVNDTVSGIKGTTDENIILVAQLTTTGSLSLNLNIQVEENGQTVNYVSTKDTLLKNEVYTRFLSYPVPIATCGCNDPNYMEYTKNLDCVQNDSCKTLIVFGCMDPKACNYNENANVNMLCCYPGQCADRDIDIVCPQLKKSREINTDEKISFTLYPNPTRTQLVVVLESEAMNAPSTYIIYDAYGRMVEENQIDFTADKVQQINVVSLKRGLYFIRLFSGSDYSTSRFIKN